MSSFSTSNVVSPGSFVTSPTSTPSRSMSGMTIGGGTGGNNGSKILHPVKRICIVGGNSMEEVSIVAENARRFGVPVFTSDDAYEFLSANDIQDVAFVLSEFSGQVFKDLNRAEATIFGPTAIAEMAVSEDTLYMSTRPLFSTAMKGLKICFNYRKKEKKEDLKRFIFMVHSMGGRVMANIAQQTPKVTHLVANNCKGDMYTYASTFEIPIVQDSWITEAWERRREAGFSAEEDKFQTKWKVMPFHGANVFILGFKEEEKRDMLVELARNGGKECQSYHEPGCTHVVVDNNNLQTMPPDIRGDIYVVKMEWFWASIQMDACAEEQLHLFSDYVNTFMSPMTVGSSATLFSPSTPGSHGRRKKRRTEAVRQLAQSDMPSLLHSGMKKARSSLGDLAATSGGTLSSSFVVTNTSGSLALIDMPDKKKAELAGTTTMMNIGTPTKESVVMSPQRQQSMQRQRSVTSPQMAGAAAAEVIKPRSARWQVFAELVQTEKNYVGILGTIDEVFKRPLEEDPKMAMLLNPTQMKIIFGNVSPILRVHKSMLQDLEACLQNWREHCCIGSIIGKYASDLMRAYPPFVNFFEDTKKTLEECDKTNPRFHAFLKVCQSRNECGRQTLAELLIRPVQRLGSITLLLKDLLKHTKREKDHPDGPALEVALDKIKEVLTNINDDKRKTEGQIHIFEIFSDIENCPPHLVSSNRNFVTKIDVVELGGSDELCGKGSDLTLFLFSDVLEIGKRRRHNNGGMGSSSLISKSPSTMSLRNTGGGGGVGGGLAAVGPMMMQHHAPSRPHKHVVLMDLNAIRRVVDLLVSEECQDCFALVCRTTQELKERMFVFQIVSDNVRKDDFLRQLCRNVANAMYRQDPDAFLATVPAVDIGISLNDLCVNKTYRSLHRVKKAFSFSRTPTTSRLTRVVSGMISPLRDRINSTPSGDLENLRLQQQSCCNLMGASAGESPARRMTMTPGRRFLPMGPPSAPSPMMMMSKAGSTVAALSSSSSDSESMDSPKSVKSGGFTIPKTPTHHSAVRRASFKFYLNSLSKKF